MRDAFAVLFFVSVGILFHPRFLLESPGLVAATLAVVMLGKPLTALAVVVFLRYPLQTALSVALATAQIGEFSFILATVGERLGVIDDRARNAIIAAAILSITVNPLLYRLVRPLERILQRIIKTPAPEGVPTRVGSKRSARYRAIIVGYGPVGRTLARLLRDNQIEPVVIELNVETVRRLTGEGMAAIYGDATHRETLESADVGNSVALVLSSSTMHGTAETIRFSRELNPRVLIFARSTYLREVKELNRAGADLVFSGEGEVAMAMMESMLRQIRATPDQLDRERERVRSDLFRDFPSDETVSESRTLPHPNDEVPAG
jgi:CPA2 family monovalent cation:H+ antiporter-2